jgi:hypothetical protein
MNKWEHIAKSTRNDQAHTHIHINEKLRVLKLGPTKGKGKSKQPKVCHFHPASTT